MGTLPRAAAMSCWLGAALRGTAPAEVYADTVTGSDPRHLVTGLGGDPEPVSLIEALGVLRRLGAGPVLLAFPTAGDPVGLAGPAVFNLTAIEAGSAVLLPGPDLGLVPTLDARTVVWQVHSAQMPAPLDPVEASRALRAGLLDVTGRLAGLDVASWQPEIPDLLLNLRHRAGPALPDDVDPVRAQAIDKALLCLDIVALAVDSDGGSVTSYEITRRREALADLDRLARRALVAACSG
jgi:hypothetical protein